MGLGSLLSFVIHPVRAEDDPEPLSSGIQRALTPKEILEHGGGAPYSFIQQTLNTCSVPGLDPRKIQVQLEENLSAREEKILKCGHQLSSSRVQEGKSRPCQVVQKREYNTRNY